MLDGLVLATLSFWSAAARRRIAVFGPPGGVGEEGRAEDEPMGVPAGVEIGEEGLGEDCIRNYLATTHSKNKFEEEDRSWGTGHAIAKGEVGLTIMKIVCMWGGKGVSKENWKTVRNSEGVLNANWRSIDCLGGSQSRDGGWWSIIWIEDTKVEGSWHGMARRGSAFNASDLLVGWVPPNYG